MDKGRYDRQISMLCPTCGSSQFEHDQNADGTVEIAKCASCGRELTTDELIRENSENLSEHINEIGNEVVQDLAEEMRKSLKTAFRGSKNFRIK